MGKMAESHIQSESGTKLRNRDRNFQREKHGSSPSDQ